MLVEDERRAARFVAVEALDDYLTKSFVLTEFLGRVKSGKEIIPWTVPGSCLRDLFLLYANDLITPGEILEYI